MSGLGDRLREVRTKTGLSAQKFGGMCGVAENAQYNYEKGSRSPDGDYFERAAAAGVDVLYVITGFRSAGSLSSELAALVEAYEAAPRQLRDAAFAVLRSNIPPIEGNASAQPPLAAEPPAHISAVPLASQPLAPAPLPGEIRERTARRTVKKA